MKNEDYRDFYNRMTPEVQEVLKTLTSVYLGKIDGIGYYQNTITIGYKNGSRLKFEMK